MNAGYRTLDAGEEDTRKPVRYLAMNRIWLEAWFLISGVQRPDKLLPKP